MRSKIIEKILKETPIEIRLKVLFEMEYLFLKIYPDREATDEELKEAYEWANKMRNWVTEEYKKWEENGRPE